MVEEAGSGHPGAPMGCAPIAHILYSEAMNYNPKNSKWINRDRFVLSNGHACALQYAMLHLSGGNMSIEDLKSLRKLNSKTPGHPESHLTEGIEVTTGPLGQGIANAVGLALAEANLAETFNKKDISIIDHYTYCILGDGCMMEGISSEACSLAGRLKLGKLIAFYDDNKVTIDGSTDLSFHEDIEMRYKSYGWHVLSVEKGDTDFEGIRECIKKAKNITDKPTLIRIRTTIGFGAEKAGTADVHSNAFGDEGINSIKSKLGFDVSKKFHISQEVSELWKEVEKKGIKAEEEWNNKLTEYSQKYPELAEDFKRRVSNKLPENWEESLPQFKKVGEMLATRNCSNEVLNSISSIFTELIGGSADLTPSNLTRWKEAKDFFPTKDKNTGYDGRYIRYGVREHAMFAISNGIAAHGSLIPFCATFLNFLSYGLGAFRLSALSNFRVLYIMTHDSIGLGEDGPTHQPIETLALLRATPNVYVQRPADGNEVSAAYYSAFTHEHSPTVLCLSRQKVPTLENSSYKLALKGAYVLKDSDKPEVILVATGSEVSIAVDAHELLKKENISCRVVSMPCFELFEEQDNEYKQSVFLNNIPVVSCEALSTFGWSKYAHASLGMTTFGMSGDYKEVYKHFGIEPNNLAKIAKNTMEFYKSKGIQPPNLLNTPNNLSN
ncbi:transketolase [Neoconidiobolus thromboides FSU 785]|nr:transketolase [Neoconidiobolus thromboides FSU 785]